MTQRNGPKRSSSIARRFFWGIADQAGEFLRELANLREDGKNIRWFRQKYGPSFDNCEDSELLRLRDELRCLWTNGKEMPPSLVAVWDKERADATGTRLDEFICNYWLRKSQGGLVILFGEIQPDVQRPLALLAYCAHLCHNRMRVCANPDCPAPYFVAGRRDQRFCSPICAAPAKREAKLRSWRKHKGEWPSQRKRDTSRGRSTSRRVNSLKTRREKRRKRS